MQPGKQIAENLRLVRLLGRGAMGSVWLADHLALQSQVAVKFMAPAMAEDEISIQRFRQEAKAAAEIRSPHVVQVFDHGQTEDGQLYIVMELLEGEPLDRRVKRLGALPQSQVLSLVVQTCKALAKAHERGIIHRDIKPANVFLLGEDEVFVKLLDFGVAKFSGAEAINMTAAGNMVGTPAFMSPEQLFHGREIDHRGDLWSVAVVAYYAITGVRPFEGATLGELCVSIKRGVFHMPSHLRSELPAEVDQWFVRAFHPDLGQRFRTAKEMALEMERCLDASSTILRSTPSGVADALHIATFPGTAVSSHPASPTRKARRWPFILAAVAAVAGVGAAAIVLGTGAPKPAETAPAQAGPAVPAPPPATLDEVDEPDGSDDSDGSNDSDGADDPDEAPTADAADEPASTSKKPLPVRPRPWPKPSTAPKTTPDPSPDTPPPGGPGEDDRAKRAAEQLGI